jgi:integrase
METEMLQPGILFEPQAYPEPNSLTSAQWELLAKTSSLKLRKRFEAQAPAVLHPLVVLAERSGIALRRTDGSILTILQEMVRNRTTFWHWNQEDWRLLLSKRLLSRPYVAAVAYHFGGSREPVIFAMAGTYAEAIFGSGVFLQELSRLRKVLRSLGYAEAHLQNVLPSTLGHLLLENGDPRLESLNVELLHRGQGHRVDGVARGVGKISNGLAALGLIDKPLRMRNYVGWKEKDTTDVGSEWASWCGRWRETSTNRPQTRESNYSFILRIGLWLNRRHPEVKSPADWDIPLCADFLAAVNAMTVGQWELASAGSRNRTRYGTPIAANSKHTFLHALRKFLIDVEVWGWVKLRIRPHHHLATPRTVSFASRVNPRVIDDAAWLKLIWASLNIERADLLSEIHYPLAMIQAMAVVWTHAGLRQNEIKRLVLGCARGQQEDILNDDGSRVPSGTLCYLDVPASKTFQAFVKPLAAIVKDRIDAWEKERPANQAALVDERTGERVRFLFQFRGRKPGGDILNRTIIPLLCAKAGLPTFDSRGAITSHRGRASAVTALASVPKGMSLIELMQWSGHSSPTSTMHYIRIRPTKLAASFAQADHMAHMVSVLIDHEMAGKQSGQPYAFYDLGDSYCTNPFWSTCPHRMACAGCDFNLPKESARGHALESKASIRRYLEEVPLSADERGIVEGDLVKIEGLIEKLTHVPCLDGRTPAEISGMSE